MANFIHAKEHLNSGDIVSVNCSHQCNVMLMTDLNFQHYRRGERFQYYGGFFTHFPARISTPSTGYWNIIIDLGGGRANIQYSINIIR
ncbi:protein of unknown function [Pasteurella multocida]|uniref:DUF1883 domain-containing protein n=1 Tax=Pasteurella multocida TaxID=747 RepID=UPI0008E69233|nr:DUF1883 domain-containing protein [Pasteurella multocida]MDY0642771.1 DUF1883 domain-containing protein [Pasteurella multocida]MEE3748067.1 DUF1883 domain-containing protein [Pasteurella multocida]SFO72320.1 protein of unknown function [Pasteurella multocida]VEE38084.1 Domain of uncharacterised function (DUF1883) [Pasteurella multocida subsp. gallicida]HDR0999173.1 DUF1883 domain-containing protein [Pasteurella multocida]